MNKSHTLDRDPVRGWEHRPRLWEIFSNPNWRNAENYTCFKTQQWLNDSIRWLPKGDMKLQQLLKKQWMFQNMTAFLIKVPWLLKYYLKTCYILGIILRPLLTPESEKNGTWNIFHYTYFRWIILHIWFRLKSVAGFLTEDLVEIAIYKILVYVG